MKIKLLTMGRMLDLWNRFLLLWMMLVTISLWGQLTLGTSPYTQDFNSIGSGLPTGWTVRTGASATVLGTVQSLTTAATAWDNTAGSFKNFASSDGLTSTSTTTNQSASTNRALGVRPSNSFGDPGAAFVLQLANTTGKASFNLSFKLLSLDAATGRTITWRVDYGVGNGSPTTYTAVAPTSGTMTTGPTFGSSTINVALPAAVSGSSTNVWIRIVALAASSGGGTRPSAAIDDVSLSWSPSCLAPTVDAATAAANTSTTGVDLSGSVTAVGGANVTEVGFNYGTTTSFGSTSSTTGLAIATSPYAISRTLSGLTANTLYYYRAYAVNNCSPAQTSYSHSTGYPSFTTLSLAPTSSAADNILTTAFRANWLAPTGQGSASTTYHLQISATNDFSSTIYDNDALTATNYTQSSSLAANTAYFYRVRVKNAGGYSAWSTVQTVTTASSNKPTVTASSFTGTVGLNFNQSIIATNIPDSYAVVAGSNLPAGLTLNTTTGAITGVPTTAGVFTTNVTATKGADVSDPVAISFTIAKGSQTISGLVATQSKVYGDANYTLSATATSGLTVTYSSSDLSVASIVDGNSVKIIGVGTSTITAHQIGDSNWNAATDITQTLTVTAKPLTIVGLTAETKVYDRTTSVVVSGTPTYSGLANGDTFDVTGSVTWAFQNKTAGVNKTLVRTGDYNAPSANYTVTQPVLQATITKKDIAITSITVADKVYNGSAVAAFSGISSTGVISGDAVTFTATGTFSDANAGDDKTVTVSAIGLSGNDSANYNVPVMPTGLTASISKANQVISFDAIPDLNVGASVDLNSYVIKTSNLPLTFVSSTPAVASLTGDVLMGNNIGTTTITASQAGNINYNAAESIQGQVNVVEQPVAFAQWDFTGYGGQNQTAAVTLLAQTIHAGIDAGSANLVRGAGAPQSNANNSFRTTGFSNNGISTSNTDYFQTTFTSSQNIMSLKEIRAQVAGTASFVASPGVTTQFAYSLNGTTFTLINSPAILISAAPFANVDLSGVDGLQNIPAGTTVTFRFYASGQTTTGGFGFNSPNSGSYGLEFYGNVKPSVVTWDGSAWTNYNGPDKYQNALITGNYNEVFGFETKDLTIAETGSLTIAAEKDVVVHGNVILPENGKIIIENDATLVQTNTGADTNPTNYSILVKRESRMPTVGYTFWSSPLSGQNLYSFSNGYNQANGGTGDGTPWNRFYVYKESTDTFVTSISNEITLDSNSVFQTGRGYAIKGMNVFGNEDYPTHEFSFTGKLNNGQLFSPNLKNSCTVENGCEKGYNMVGNPYPSNIDFEALYEANSSKIYATAYFWTNNDITVTQQQGNGYSGNNYAIYNLSGGTGAVDPDPNQGNAGVVPPNGIIKVGQGFIVKAKVAGKDLPLEFNNDIRVGYDPNAIFFNSKKADKNRFWLTLTSPANVANSILVAYLPEATNGFEINYDGELFVIGSDSFYSILGSRKLAIQGKADFNVDDKVALGNVYSKNGEYRISIKNKEGIFKTGQTIYLKDKVLNKVVNLSQGDYVFQGVKGTDATRFEIVYKEDAVLAADSSAKSHFNVYKDGNSYVVTSANKLGKVEVYDTAGRLVRSLSTNVTTTRIDASAFSSGVYILKVENSGDVKTKKVIK